MSTQQPSQDLILRPTDLEPGIYTAHDEDGPYCFMVCCYQDGKTYEMVWCPGGFAKKYRLAGDLLFEGVFQTGMQVEYPEGSPVEVVALEPAKGYR